MIGLNRRRTMGNALPYDAEVEYLESSGTQYIDTGVNLNKATTIKIVVRFTKRITAASVICGSHFDNQPSPKTQIYITNSSTFQYNTTNVTVSGVSIGQSVVVGNTYTITIKNNIIGNEQNAPLFIFQRNNDHGDYLPINGMEVLSCVISQDGLPVRDYIPVKANNIGYLYDKVSKKLFGNSGTGNFILGNDVN